MATTDRAAERQRREIEDWQGGLDALHARIAGRFRRAEVRERVRRSHDRTSGKQAIPMVSAWATANRLVLARV